MISVCLVINKMYRNEKHDTKGYALRSILPTVFYQHPTETDEKRELLRELRRRKPGQCILEWSWLAAAPLLRRGDSRVFIWQCCELNPSEKIPFHPWNSTHER
jgi:hypothetical protein